MRKAQGVSRIADTVVGTNPHWESGGPLPEKLARRRAFRGPGVASGSRAAPALEEGPGPAERTMSQTRDKT